MIELDTLAARLDARLAELGRPGGGMGTRNAQSGL